MVKLKSYFNVKKVGVGSAGIGLFFASAMANALDTTAVQTALTAAQGDGEAVGLMVIGVIAALLVVTIVIGMLRKTK